MISDTEKDKPSSVDQEISADTYLVDQVRKQTDEIDAVERDLDIPQQIQAMRNDIKNITNSLSLLAEGARSIAVKAPNAIEDELVSLVRARPMAAILGTVAFSFLLTSFLTRNID